MGNKVTLLTPEEAMEKLGIRTRFGLSELIRKGLPCYRVGRLIRISQEDLDRYLAKKKGPQIPAPLPEIPLISGRGATCAGRSFTRGMTEKY
jgi:excisionase family DNA binding protein